MNKTNKLITDEVRNLLDHTIKDAPKAIKDLADKLNVPDTMTIRTLLAYNIIIMALGKDPKMVAELLDRLEGKVPSDTSININMMDSLIDITAEVINKYVSDEATKEAIAKTLSNIDLGNLKHG